MTCDHHQILFGRSNDELGM